MSENAFAFESPVFSSNADDERSPLIQQPHCQDEFGIEENRDLEVYSYSFLIATSDLEIDVTTTDTQVTVIASNNERKGPENNSLPPVSLSCMLPIPDDAETSTVKVKFLPQQMLVTLNRMANGMLPVRGRKLFVQSD